MNNLEEDKNNVKKIYGDENLKEILTKLIENEFIKEIKNVEKLKK